MDPLTFPMLAGTALTEAVKFLFDRAGAVLDRRAGRVPVEEPEHVEGQVGPLTVRPAELSSARIERITEARGALQVYLTRPALMQADGPGLRDLLGALRLDLEEIYGRQLPFGDEEERPSRPGVSVTQRAEQLTGSQVGVRAQDISRTGRVRVDQSARVIEAAAEQVGVEIDGTIG
ncbi:hypothetical protein OHB13_19505 [Streptomyces sp. NBC_00440]|uniref:hypothetical protein n=1 Tax=unclassified Streptomyces TaxID=2593676 RepID=UPI002E20400C|nr:hypothetical protein OG221_18095 [Streptomyces sp. NBC_00932]